MKASISRCSKIVETPRVVQLCGMFDVPPTQQSQLTWEIDLPIEDKPWNVGLIVGPSGCGKSTIARELFPKAYVTGYKWSPDRSVIDGFPKAISIRDITQLLGSVGFSSPPAWLRPYEALSNGEKFRVTLARALAENRELCVFDEFTSVVDRNVGQIGSAAVAKTVRRREQRFIAVTCHDDVIEWLDPDWIYQPALGTFQWRELHGRPKVTLEVCRVRHTSWRIFAPHHYLNASGSTAAAYFCAFVEGKPVAISAWLPFVGRRRSAQQIRRVHRVVCLPDYQGIGIGNALTDYIASMYRGLGYRAVISSSHPAVINGYARSSSWRMMSRPALNSRSLRERSIKKKTVGYRLVGGLSSRSINRLTASFEYVGSSLGREDAERTLNAWGQENAPPGEGRGVSADAA